ncbi:conserved hypothetical protein [groundwater metagenome]|uniref:Methyltransferase type 11 domain-containing protein n=1 Tax=groundwater metagenome TaxID=717931 RepID=A0A098EEM2_9ZZZZ
MSSKESKIDKETLKDIVEWDVKNWSNGLKYWEKETRLDLSKCRALEIGARNGGCSLWLALHGCSVVCSDLNGPTEKAKKIHKKYGVSNLIEYASVDVTNIPYEDNTFDIVIFKSVIGGVGRDDHKERQTTAFREINRVLKHSGELFFAENLDASSLHKFIRKTIMGKFRKYRWTTSWRWINLDELEEFLSPFSSVKYATYGFFGAFHLHIYPIGIFLGTIDKFIEQFTPKSWKYIAFGIAIK